MKAMLLLLILISAAAACQDQDRGIAPPGVLVGQGLMSKALLGRYDSVGEVTDIAFGRLDGVEEPRLILAGTRAYAALDPSSYELIGVVPFETELAGVAMTRRILDVDGDGDLDFMTLAADWIGRTARHGSDGNVIWAHPSARDSSRIPAVVATAFGDVDADGSLEFLMTFNATSEVHLLDASGKLLLSQPWGCDSVLFLDVDGDGEKDIVYIDGEDLWARDGSGEVLARTWPPEGGYVNHLEIVRAVGEPAQDWLLVGHHVKKGSRAGQNYHLVGLDAKTIGPRVEWAQIELHCERPFVGFQGTPGLAGARIDVLQKQAPIAGFSATRLRLRVLDDAWKVVYEEILMPPEGETARTDGACLFLPAGAGDLARLLVAYGDTVWVYTIARQG
jgi:hypothetical protein